MNQKDINELHALIVNWAIDHDFSTQDILCFFSSTLVGTMAMHNYTEERVDAILSSMKQRFLKHPARKSQEKEKPIEKDYIFSKELRDAMAPFGKMDVNECLKSKEFFRTLCKHAGMTDDEFEKILKDAEFEEG